MLVLSKVSQDACFVQLFVRTLRRHADEHSIPIHIQGHPKHSWVRPTFSRSTLLEEITF